jgi:hypothetical protein
MKKIILIIVAVTFIANCINAQENRTDFRDKVQFGLKIGTNYSNVYDTKGEGFNSDPKFGWVTGGFLAIPIGKYLGIQPEILYSQKGFHATGSIIGRTYNITRTTTFIDVPLFLTLKPSEFLTLLAGPQYSYLIKQRDVFANTTTTIDQEQEFENDNMRKNILCLLYGMDLNLKHVIIGVRVGIDVLNNNGDGTSATPNYKNVWYQATFGYRFY